MKNLHIPENIFQQMLAQAKGQAPVEACGILAGKDSSVEKLYEMTNVDNSSVHFMMEPKEQFNVLKAVRAADLEILAIYHSHPNSPARPSAEDIRLALTPGVTYVIVSLQNPNQPAIKGFLIDDDNITEVPVKIVERQNA